MIVAAVGIAINAATAWLFASGQRHDLNIRSAYLHMASDAVISAGVVLAGFAILMTGWSWLDPAVSLGIVVVIAWSTWGLLAESLAMSLKATPSQIDTSEVHHYLAALPGVAAIHDLHIWPMSTTDTALTVHLVMPGGHPGDKFITNTANALKRDFGIGHATVQIEIDPATECMLASDREV